MQDILKLDVAGVPQCWITPQEAAPYYAKGEVVWTVGDVFMSLRGGFNRPLGKMSVIDLHPVIATKGYAGVNAMDRVPTLTNRALFARDRYLCMYCGEKFSAKDLTRDHVVAISRLGKDEWSNVVTSCRADNSRKGADLLTECGMKLLAVPTVPSFIEGLLLARGGKQILSDQLAFLEAQIPLARRGLA